MFHSFEDFFGLAGGKGDGALVNNGAVNKDFSFVVVPFAEGQEAFRVFSEKFGKVFFGSFCMRR